MSTVLLHAGDRRRTLGRMAHEILESNSGAEGLVVVGILRRGWPVAKRLAFLMTQIEGTTVPCGKIDTRPYRDDVDRRAHEPIEDLSEVPFEMTGKRVGLLHELISTGQTIRAAMDGVMKFGRPRSIELAVLIDRGHRELPITPNYCGKSVPTEKGDHIIV